MPSSLRDPKTLTRWLDLDAYRRARRAGRTWKRLLLVTLALSLVGVAAPLVLGKRSVFQTRPVSAAHASFNQDCSQCHVEAFRTFDRLRRLDPAVRAVPDSACTRCHAGPTHHATQVGAPACASCHKEHRGHAALRRVADGHCTACHADLRRNDGQAPAFDPHVRGFAAGHHPEFGLFAGGRAADPGTVRFNHAVHLAEEGVWDIDREQRARQAAGAPGDESAADELPRRRVRLECRSCHQPDATGRFMQPVRYEQHCQTCHPLAVRLVGDGEEPCLRELAREFHRTPVPHPPPGGGVDVVRGVLRDRLTRLILRAGSGGSGPAGTPGADDLLAPSPAEPLPREPFAWVNAQQAAAERRLFEGAGGCAYCHREKTAPGARPGGLPEYLPANIPARWLGHAAFDHKSHRMLTCTECHAAPASARAADVLLPRIDTCRKCHDTGAGKARADCVECHTYHDHGGRAEFRGRLTIGEGTR
jgi:hypothetical protein